jgi:hypothetical protein
MAAKSMDVVGRMDLQGCCQFAEILEVNDSKMNTQNMMEDKIFHIIFATLLL